MRWESECVEVFAGDPTLGAYDRPLMLFLHGVLTPRNGGAPGFSSGAIFNAASLALGCGGDPDAIHKLSCARWVNLTCGPSQFSIGQDAWIAGFCSFVKSDSSPYRIIGSYAAAASAALECAGDVEIGAFQLLLPVESDLGEADRYLADVAHLVAWGGDRQEKVRLMLHLGTLDPSGRLSQDILDEALSDAATRAPDFLKGRSKSQASMLPTWSQVPDDSYWPGPAQVGATVIVSIDQWSSTSISWIFQVIAAAVAKNDIFAPIFLTAARGWRALEHLPFTMPPVAE